MGGRESSAKAPRQGYATSRGLPAGGLPTALSLSCARGCCFSWVRQLSEFHQACVAVPAGPTPWEAGCSELSQSPHPAIRSWSLDLASRANPLPILLREDQLLGPWHQQLIFPAPPENRRPLPQARALVPQPGCLLHLITMVMRCIPQEPSLDLPAPSPRGAP